MEPYAAVRERLAEGATIVLDGGIGSELVRRGVRWRGNGLRTDADAVRQVHEDYLAAGADVIRTDTFQLSQRTFLNVFRNREHLLHIGAPGLDYRAAELLRRAVEVAGEARQRSGRTEVPIAGVMSPLEHCYRPDLVPPSEQAEVEHLAVANALATAGADLLFIQSMNTSLEARAAARAAKRTELPIWVSFSVDDQGNVLNGEPLDHAVHLLDDLEVDAVLVSGAPVEHVDRAIGTVVDYAGRPAGALAQIGRFDPPSWKFEFFPQFTDTEACPPDRYAAATRGWIARGARIVGGDHGTTPAHIRAITGLGVGA